MLLILYDLKTNQALAFGSICLGFYIMLLYTVISKIWFLTPDSGWLTFFAYILNFLIFNTIIGFCSMNFLMCFIIGAKSKFFRRISLFTGIFEMHVVLVLFKSGFRGPGGVGFWTLQSVVNLVSVPIMFKSLTLGVKLHITYLTICIMAISNMI